MLININLSVIFFTKMKRDAHVALLYSSYVFSQLFRINQTKQIKILIN